MPEGAMMAEELEPQAEAPEVETPDVPDTPEVVADTPETPAEPLSIEQLAAEAGWVPKDQFRGDGGAEWKDAATFVKDTVRVNRSLRQDLRATREAAERAAKAAATITDRAVEAERLKLLQERQQAFDAGDGQAFTAVERQLSSLPQPTVPAASTETQDFLKRNSTWYGVDPIATQIAYNICEQYSKTGADYATQLAEAEKVIRQRFPEYNPKVAGKGPAMVETSASRSTVPRKGPKGYNDLPPEAKKAAQDFAKRGRATVEEYAKFYFEENA